jgi:hypothetical protein
MEAPLGGAGVTGAFAQGWGWCWRRGRLQMRGYGVGMVVDAMMGAELSCRSLCWNVGWHGGGWDVCCGLWMECGGVRW